MIHHRLIFCVITYVHISLGYVTDYTDANWSAYTDSIELHGSELLQAERMKVESLNLYFVPVGLPSIVMSMFICVCVSVCLSVCLSVGLAVSLSVRSHNSKVALSNFTKFFMCLRPWLGPPLTALRYVL